MNESTDYFRLLIKRVVELNLLVQIDKEMINHTSSIRARELSYLLGRMQTLSLDRCVMLTAVLLDEGKRPNKKFDTVSIPIFVRHLERENSIGKPIADILRDKILKMKPIFDACMYYRDKSIAHIENLEINKENIEEAEKHKLGFSQLYVVAESLSDLCDFINSEVFSKRFTVERTFDHLLEIQQLKKLGTNS